MVATPGAKKTRRKTMTDVDGGFFDKWVWCVADYTDGVYWVYSQDGSTMFVAMM